jgi:hypothetical protein
MDLADIRERGRAYCQNPANRSPTERERAHSSDKPKQKAFRQKLTYQSCCRGSQRYPGDGLVVAPSGSRHQKIGEIGGSDQQNEGDATEQKQ